MGADTQESLDNRNLQPQVKSLFDDLKTKTPQELKQFIENSEQTVNETMKKMIQDDFLELDRPNHFTLENKNLSNNDKMLFVLYCATTLNIPLPKGDVVNNIDDYFIIYLNARQNNLKSKQETLEEQQEINSKLNDEKESNNKDFESLFGKLDLKTIGGIEKFFSGEKVENKIQDLLKYKQENKELFKEKFSRDAFQMYLQNNLPINTDKTLNEKGVEELNINIKRAFLTFGVLFGNYRYGLDLTTENLENESVKEFLKQNVRDIYNIADFDKSKENAQEKAKAEEKKEREKVEKGKNDAKKRAKENYEQALKQAEENKSGDDILAKKSQAEMQQKALEEYTKQIDSVKIEGIKAVYGKYVSEGGGKETKVSNVASILKNKFPDSVVDNGVEELELELDYTKLTAGDVYALKKEGFFIPALFLIDSAGNRPKNQEDLNKAGTKFIVTFKSLGSSAINNDLEQTIGAGDLLIDYGLNNGNIPTKVKIGNEEGTLKLDPRVGYYNESGKYLPIYSGFEIEILESLTGDFNQINQAFDERARLQRKEDFDNYMQNQIANNYGADFFELKPMSDSALDREILDAEMSGHGITKNPGGKYLITKEQQEALKKEYYNIYGGIDGGHGSDGGFMAMSHIEADKQKDPNRKNGAICSYIAWKEGKDYFNLDLPKGNTNDVGNNYPNIPYKGNGGPLLGITHKTDKNFTGANVMDITMNVSPSNNADGHRVLAYKFGGQWWVLESYYGNPDWKTNANRVAPIKLDEYLLRTSKGSPQFGSLITKVAYYNSTRISPEQAEEGVNNNNLGLANGKLSNDNDKQTFGKLSSFLSGPHRTRLAEHPGIVTTVKKYCAQYGIPPALVFAVMKQESGYNPDAKSHAGAKGLIQLMPGTATQMGVLDPHNIEQNIMGGVKYMKMISSMYNGNVELILAGYNAGPYNKAVKAGRIPANTETRNYVYKIMKDYKTLTSMGI